MLQLKRKNLSINLATRLLQLDQLLYKQGHQAKQRFQVLTLFSLKNCEEELAKTSQYSLIHEEGNEFMLMHYKLHGRMHKAF